MKKAQEVLTEILLIPEENFEQYVVKLRKEIVDFHIKKNTSYREFIGNVSSKN